MPGRVSAYFGNTESAPAETALARPIQTALHAVRSRRRSFPARSFLRAPVVVQPREVLRSQQTIRVVCRAVRAAADLRRTVRYQTPLLMAPIVVSEVAPALPPPIRRELVSSRTPRTLALLQPWTIRGPPAPVVATLTVHTVASRRPKTLSRFIAPALPAPEVTRARVQLARAPKARVRSFYIRPGLARPEVATTRVDTVRSPVPRVRSLYVRPAAGLEAAAPEVTKAIVRLAAGTHPRPLDSKLLPQPQEAPLEQEPVATVTRTSLARRRPDRRPWSFLRAPIGVSPPVSVVTQTLAPKRATVTEGRARSFFVRPAVEPGATPTPSQSSVFAPPAAPTRRPRTRSFYTQTNQRPVVGVAPSPSQTTVFVSLAKTRAPVPKSKYVTPAAIQAETPPDTTDLTPVACDDLTLATTSCDDLTLATTSDDALSASSGSCDTLTLGAASDDSLTITPDT